jgi:TorA maturation chaperone TorD
MEAIETCNAEIARAKAYKAMAECYYPPVRATIDHARHLSQNLKALCPAASEAADRMEAALLAYEGVADLAIDHARLFVGPFALLAPPYGSVYLDGERRCMGDSTLDVGSRYREVGLGTAAGFNDAPDHIAAELEFMHFLVIKELEALAGKDLDRAQHFRQKQNSFLERHLAAWVPVFTRNVEEQAQTRFYQDLAAATRLFIEREFEKCRGDVPVLVSGSASA